MKHIHPASSPVTQPCERHQGTRYWQRLIDSLLSHVTPAVGSMRSHNPNTGTGAAALTAMTDCGLGYGEQATEFKDNYSIARSCSIASSSFPTRCQWLSLELENQQKEYQVGPWVPQKVLSTKEQAPCANPNVSKVQRGSQGEGRWKGGAERTQSCGKDRTLNPKMTFCVCATLGSLHSIQQ